MNLDDARELGRLAYRRDAQPFAILDPQLTAQLPSGPDTADAKKALLLAWFDGYGAAKAAGEPRTDPPLPTPPTTLTITHTSADGTMLEGSSKGDGAWEAIKAAQSTYKIRGWRYMPSIRAIAVSHSRDRAPQLMLISRTAEVLREAGFVVEIMVDGAPRAMEESEADRAERLDDRADALTAKSERKGAEADRRWDAAQAIAEHIPAGQPILRGHHSERGHRRDLQRIDTLERKSLELQEESERAAAAAKSAQRHMDLREAPRVVHNRIERLAAERRKVQRALDGYVRNARRHDGSIYYQSVTPPASGLHREQLEGQAAHLDVQVPYWEGILAEHQAAGRWNPTDAAAIKRGDYIQCGGVRWYPVVKVNKKTVRVDTGRGTTMLDLTSITAHRPATELADDAAAVVDLDAAEVNA